MPRPTKADRKKPRPDRPRPTDAAPRGPKNFKLAVVALSAIAFSATFFSAWMLWNGVIRDYLMQLRMVRNGVWPTADDAIREALAGNPDAPRMQAAFQALLTADQVLSGRANAAQLPEDLKTPFATDWDNGITRLCAATLAAARQAALGSGTADRYTAYERVIRDGSMDRSTVYRPEWTTAWKSALRARGLSLRSASTPGVQGLLTPAKFLNGLTIGTLPKLISASSRLAAQLDADGNRKAAAKIRADVVATLRRFVTSDGAVANTLLCSDLLLRMANDDPAFDATRRKLADSWNHRLRNALHDAVNSEPDRTEISQSPVVGPMYEYWQWVSWIAALACALMLATGMLFAFVFAIIWLVARRAHTGNLTDPHPQPDQSNVSAWRLSAVLLAVAWVIAVWTFDGVLIRTGPPWAVALFGLGAAFLVGVLSPWVLDRCFWTIDRSQTLTGVLLMLIALAASAFSPFADYSAPDPFRLVFAWASRIAIVTTVAVALLAAYLRSNLTPAQTANPCSRRVLFLSAASATTGLIAVIIALVGSSSRAGASFRQFAIAREVQFLLREELHQHYFDDLATSFSPSMASTGPATTTSTQATIPADAAPYNRSP